MGTVIALGAMFFGLVSLWSFLLASVNETWLEFLRDL